MKYSLEKNEDGAKIITVKKSPWCNNVQLNKVQLLVVIRDVLMYVAYVLFDFSEK